MTDANGKKEPAKPAIETESQRIFQKRHKNGMVARWLEGTTAIKVTIGVESGKPLELGLETSQLRSLAALLIDVADYNAAMIKEKADAEALAKAEKQRESEEAGERA